MVQDERSSEAYAFIDPSRYKFNVEFETYKVKRLNNRVIHFMPFNQKYVNFLKLFVLFFGCI